MITFWHIDAAESIGSLGAGLSHHAFATELIAAGADIGTVAKLMGHTSPTMVLNHYQYVMDKQKRAAVEALPDFAYVPKPCAQRKKQSAT